MTGQMTITKQHGGSRPKQRADDQRGGAGRGQGRKLKSFTVKLDDPFYVTIQDAEGRPIGLGELWRVADISRQMLTITSDTGDTIRLRR